MKVGDIVRQCDGVIKIKGRAGKNRGKSLGVVIAIHEDILPKTWESNSRRKSWVKLLGRRVDVMWRNGKLTKGFAENSLEVVCEVTPSQATAYPEAT